MPSRLGKRIIIIGNSGSGKSTVSYQLGELLQLPVTHLDKEYWHEGWVPTPKEEWEERTRTLISGAEWILEGNFSSTLEMRLSRADTVLFLDYNRLACLFGVIKRWLTHLGKTRPDMAEGCPEKFDFAFFKWVLWGFPTRSRTKIIQCLASYKENEQIVVKSRAELKRFLATVARVK